MSSSGVEAIFSELNKRLEPAGRRVPGANMLDTISRIQCADGFTVSVQASRTHYCNPRDNEGPWYQVEVGFPSERVEKFLPFAENSDDPTGTVYGWVPLKLVAEVIAEHGGFAEAQAA